MKFILLFFALMISASSLAHEDHFLGDSIYHSLYHWIFFALCVTVIYKAVVWFQRKSKQNKPADSAD